LSMVKSQKCTQSTKVSIDYTFIKLPRNGNSKGENKIIKNNSVYRSYQAQPMKWRHLVIFHISSIHKYKTTQEEGHS